MKWTRALFLLLILAMALPNEGCKKGPSKSRKNNKKVKKGKPIPCPIKDC